MVLERNVKLKSIVELSDFKKNKQGEKKMVTLKKFIVSGTIRGKRVIISQIIIRSKNKKDAAKKLTSTLKQLKKRGVRTLGNPRLIRVL